MGILKIKLVTVVFYSSIYTEKQWYGNFKVQLYFSHGKTNSWGVRILFYRNVNAVVKNQFNYDNGKILILEKTIDETQYLLVNVYTAITK